MDPPVLKYGLTYASPVDLHVERCTVPCRVYVLTYILWRVGWFRCPYSGRGPHDGGASDAFLPGRVSDDVDDGGQVHQPARPGRREGSQ